MKRLFKIALVCCLSAALFVVAAGCAQNEVYKPTLNKATVTTPTIGTDGTLKVGVNAKNAPLAGTPNNSAKIVGIDVDVAAALADSMGLKLEIVDIGSDPQGAISDGRVDIVMGVDGSDTSYKFWKSNGYLPKVVALFSKSSNTTVPKTTDAISIATQLTSQSAWAVSNTFSSSTIKSVDSLENACKAVENGEVTYMAADSVVGSYYTKTSQYDLKMIATLGTKSNYVIGVSQSNSDLQKAIETALKEITGNGVLDTIQKKWLGSDYDVNSLPALASTSSTTDSSTESDAA